MPSSHHAIVHIHKNVEFKGKIFCTKKEEKKSIYRYQRNNRDNQSEHSILRLTNKYLVCYNNILSSIKFSFWK